MLMPAMMSKSEAPPRRTKRTGRMSPTRLVIVDLRIRRTGFAQNSNARSKKRKKTSKTARARARRTSKKPRKRPKKSAKKPRKRPKNCCRRARGVGLDGRFHELRGSVKGWGPVGLAPGFDKLTLQHVNRDVRYFSRHGADDEQHAHQARIISEMDIERRGAASIGLG